MTAAQAWIVRAGQDDEYADLALDRGLVGIGWRRAGDLRAATTQRAVRSLVAEAYPHQPASVRTLHALQLHAFRSMMQPGHHVLLLRQGTPEVALGEVTGDYAYRPGGPGEPPHVRSVRWIDPRLRRDELGSDLLTVPGLYAVSRVTRLTALARITELASGGPTPGPAAADPAPIEHLRRNLARARDLTGGGRNLEELGITGFDHQDIYRAAWVQAVASLDHWMRGEIGRRTRALLDGPASAWPLTFGHIVAQKVHGKQNLQGEAAIRAAMAKHFEPVLSRASFQSPAKIRDRLGDVADVTNLWPRVAEILGGHPPVDVEARLNEVAQRRHHIVHQNDQHPTDPTGKEPIGLGETMAAIGLVERTAEAILVVVDAR